MNYNSDLPGEKQATKGDKKFTVIYYMDKEASHEQMYQLSATVKHI